MEISRRSFLTTAAATTAIAATICAGPWTNGDATRDWTGNTPVSYPEPAWEIMDKKFGGRQGNAKLERLWTGALWLEGPVYMGDWKCFPVQRHSQPIACCAGTRTTAVSPPFQHESFYCQWPRAGSRRPPHCMRA